MLFPQIGFRAANYPGAILIIVSLFLLPSLKAQDYVLVWGDEFNTPGMPDQTKWGYEKGLLRNKELQYFTENRSENSRIEDSLLIIELRKEAWEGSDYTSSSLISKGIGDWLYGKVEISAKVPTGKGTWPALWMMPTYEYYGGWPKSGEIDIMEYIGVEPENLFYTVHFEGTDGTGHQSNGNGGSSSIVHPYDQFIKFTMEWTPDKIQWYANDVKTHEYNKPSDDPREWPFNKEFYLIMNLAYGGTWGGYAGVDDSKLPHQLLIDYVRVYQRRESDGPFELHIPPVEGGSVEISPDLESYPDSTEVRITAVPHKGYAFKSWKHLSGANPYTFIIRKDMEIQPQFIDEFELILNGKFHENTDHWVSYIFDENTAAMTMDVVDSMLAIDVYPSPGTNWHAGFQQLNLSLNAGAYTLRFDAHAPFAEEMLISVAENHSDYSAYIDINQAITTIPDHYELKFTMPEDESNARLFFGMGKFEGEAFLDNISLQKVQAVGINQSNRRANEKSIIVYPNPTSGSFTVQSTIGPGAEAQKIQLIGIHGEILSETEMSGGIERMDLSDYEPGIFCVRLISSTSVSSQRIILIK